MHEFSDRPFVAGSVIGLRAFWVHPNGMLDAPIYDHLFTSGVNEADCPMTPDGRAFNRAMLNADRRAAGKPQFDYDGHTVAAADCTCGFYAYADGKNDYLRPNADRGHLRIAGIVEGTGVVTIGRRGFRASKLRILGLIQPQVRMPRRYAVAAGYWAGCLAAATTLGITEIHDHDWTGLGIDIIWATLAVAGLKLAIPAHRRALADTRRKRNQQAERFAVMRVRYPDIPIYPDKRAAVAAHPITDLTEYTEDQP